jgi:hypothetical protein
MTREDVDELRTRQDICRAEFMVALTWGLARDASAEALRYRAAAEGVSLHAAALAVIATEPTEQLLTDVPPPEPPAVPRHLYALRSVPADEETTTTGARRGRHRRR